MEMGRIKKPLGTAIDPNLAEELDAWVKANPPWRKVDVLERAIRMFLDSKTGDADESN